MEVQIETKKSLGRARIGLVILTLVTVMFLIYGMTQSIEAHRQRELAMQMEKKALLAEEEAIRARDLAGSCQDELVKCRAAQK